MLQAEKNSSLGKAHHKHKGGGYEYGRADEILQEEFVETCHQEGGGYK